MNLLIVLFSIATTMTLFVIVHSYLGIKKNTTRSILYLLLVVIINEVVRFYVNDLSIHAIIQSIEIFVFACLFSDKSKSEGALISCIIFVLTLATKIFVISFSSYLLYAEVVMNRIEHWKYFSTILLLTRVLTLIELLPIERYYRKLQFNLRKNDFRIYGYMMVLFTLIILGLDFLMSHDIKDLAMMVAYLFLPFLMIGIIILSFYYFHLLQENQDNEIKLMVFHYETKKNKEREDMYNTTVKLKHNLKHILDNAIMLAKQNRITELISELENYNSEVSKVKYLAVPNNQLIDYLLNLYHQRCKEKGIDFVCVVNSDLQFKIDDNDLSIILGNLMDNAIENCSGENHISLSILNRKKFIKVIITNSISEESFDLASLTRTNKDDSYHGYGIISTKEICERNNVHLIFATDKFEVSSKLLFPHS